jgi:hypothetical protein
MTEMETAMIRTLASIDAELDLPEDGCNSPARTLAAIRDLKELARRGVALACAVMTDNDQIRAD